MEKLADKLKATSLAEVNEEPAEAVADADEENLAEIKARIVREDVKLPKDFKDKLAFVLLNVFTEKECKKYIKKTEKMGYKTALVNIGFGQQALMTDVRNSDRCIWDSHEEADRIWRRIEDHVPKHWGSREVLGLNERLRFLRYSPGEYFKPHMDGSYRRPTGETSFITVQLYLNEGFKGGSTTFMNFDCNDAVPVVPKTGMVLIFEHPIMHEGSELEKGKKYAVRTDVMFSKK